MRHRVRTAWAVPLLAGLLAVTACGAGGDADGAATDAEVSAPRQDDRSGAEADAGEAGPGHGDRQDAAAEDSAEADGEAGADEAAGADRASVPELPSVHLVRTARLTVLTEDVPGAYDAAVAVAEEAGGYVSAEETTQDRRERQRSRVTLRVPPEHYARVLRDLAALGELRDREVSSEDVTSEVVDVESRIATQEESVARVRALMADAGSLTDIVQLERELTTRQAALESLKAQQKALSERTGMTTVTLLLREPEPADAGRDGEDEEEDGGPSVGDALAGGWQAFLGLLLWAVVALSAALPFLLTAALLLFVLRRYARRRGRAAVPPAPAAPPPPPAGATAGAAD